MKNIYIIAMLLLCTGCGSYCNLKSEDPNFYGGFVNAITLRHYGNSCEDINLYDWGYAAAFALPLMFVDPPASFVVDTLTLPFIPFWQSDAKQSASDNREKQKIMAVKKQKSSKKTSQQLIELAKDKSEKKRMAVAAAPNTPPQTLKKLANDKSKLVKMLVAENPSTPEETLIEMAKTEGVEVKARLAERKSAKLLIRLAHDRNKKVKLLVAKNPNAPQKALAKLATEDYVDIRISVAFNSATSAAILEKLKNDPEDSVKNAAKNPNKK
ncbi:hypothetical protein [Candidatus Uabimicrobium sp. HlEnr_7]|uniref:variant leucine-rich repeat-containing protein n=1 Tax=Candidatus Uabimicrobium helgolandensis TaxID=3095367 RepID=UPI0035587C0D